MTSRPSELFSSPTTPPEDFSRKARSAAEEFVRYCRERHLLPTYELFSQWLEGVQAPKLH